VVDNDVITPPTRMVAFRGEKLIVGPLRLQQILGHTSLEMVRRYVALASVERSLLDRRASPMDLILKSTHLRQPVGLRPQEQIHRKRPPLQLVPR